MAKDLARQRRGFGAPSIASRCAMVIWSGDILNATQLATIPAVEDRRAMNVLRFFGAVSAEIVRKVARGLAGRFEIESRVKVLQH